jgi:hypothetical protein
MFKLRDSVSLPRSPEANMFAEMQIAADISQEHKKRQKRMQVVW